MLAPQLRFYAAARAGQTAIIETSTGDIAAWVVHDGGRLRARRGPWLSEPVDSIPQVVAVVSERFTVRTPPERVER